MSDTPQYTSLRDYLRVLREQRVLVVLIILAFTAGAFAISIREPAVYRASAALLVREENADLVAVGQAAPVTQTPDQRAAISAERVTEPGIAEDAAKRLKTKIPPVLLLRKVSATPEARTNLVVISAESGSAKFAASMANAFADATRDTFVKEARNRYADRAKVFRTTLHGIKKVPANAFTRARVIDQINRLDQLTKIADPASVVRRAETPGSAISPQPIRNTLLGLLLGLTIAIIVAVVRDALDRRFKSSREIKDVLRLPLIGHVRDETLGRTVGGSNGRKPLTSEELEAFRIVRTNVDFLDVDRPITTLVVTSALPEEGKSTVAVALAAAYALAGKKALIVECDLRRPTLAKRLGLQARPGLSDYLVGSVDPKQTLQQVSVDTSTAGKSGSNGDSPAALEHVPFVCITAGTPTPEPAELLGSNRFKAFLTQVSSVYDVVILDTCPLLSVVDTLGLVPQVDGLVLCLRASKTTRDQARAARAALEHFPDRPTGIVITGVRPGDEADYGYYSYAYAYGSKS